MCAIDTVVGRLAYVVLGLIVGIIVVLILAIVAVCAYKKGMLKMKINLPPRNMKKHCSLCRKRTMKLKSAISSDNIYTKITISKKYIYFS